MKIKNKEELIENLKNMFLKEFKANLEAANLDEEEVNANIVINRKKIQGDSENIADIVFRAYGE